MNSLVIPLYCCIFILEFPNLPVLVWELLVRQLTR
jgi:hypothetical protein